MWQIRIKLIKVKNIRSSMMYFHHYGTIIGSLKFEKEGEEVKYVKIRCDMYWQEKSLSVISHHTMLLSFSYLTCFLSLFVLTVANVCCLN